MWPGCSPRPPTSCCAPRSPATCTRACRPRRPPDVHIFGRRGPAQTKFSPLEARELAHPKGLQVVMEARDLEQITDAEWETIKADKRTDQVVQTFVGGLEEQQRREAAGEVPTDREGRPVQRRLHMHFSASPRRGPRRGWRRRTSHRTCRFERTRLDAEGNLDRAPASSWMTSSVRSTGPSATTAPSCPASRTTRAARRDPQRRRPGLPPRMAPCSPASTPTAGSSAGRWG